MLQNQEKTARLWAKVVAKAWADESYKAKLIKDPAAVLKTEGLEIPQGVQLKVVEDTNSLRHLVLPALPAEAADLGEAALSERLAAYSSSCSCGKY
ncbi:MAG: NHLP leader peptide family natural product precursor [Desulfarculus sp.]|nr:NHLP leader peptide family natural product precursor [Desulfarculus sp.]